MLRAIDPLQALLQGPRQTFKLPVADFKQAELDAQNGVNYPGKSSTGLKIRLPIGKVGLAGPSSKKSKGAAPRNKSAGSARYVPLHESCDYVPEYYCTYSTAVFTCSGLTSLIVPLHKLQQHLCLYHPYCLLFRTPQLISQQDFHNMVSALKTAFASMYTIGKQRNAALM